MFDLEPIAKLFNQYQPILPLAALAILISFILTPLTGKLAEAVGAIDAPAQQRDSRDQTRTRRIHTVAMTRLGGLAIFAAIVVSVLVAGQSGMLQLNSPQLLHILAGLTLISILGFFDSRGDISGSKQLLIQVIAALIVTMGGIKILNLDILGLFINFDLVNFTIPLGSLTLYFSPIADIVSILWIVGLINAMNWVAGIDGLASSMSVVAALTLTFIGIENGAVMAAILAAITFGAILGFLPFNLPPARTFNGGIGDMTQGYMLAILAIVSGAKLTTSIILLALPIIDAVWVLGGRYIKHRKELKSPKDLLEISDKTHLHHRLLDLGLTIRQTLAVEMLIFFCFCIAAYQLAGFSGETVIAMIAVLMCLLIFVVLKVLHTLRFKRLEKLTKANSDGSSVAKVNLETPEEKYAY